MIGGEIIQEKALKFLKWKQFDVDEAMRIVKKKKNYFRDGITIKEADIEEFTPKFRPIIEEPIA